ncbi:5869_t:CDS:2, partial [Diversispora eburnea]
RTKDNFKPVPLFALFYRSDLPDNIVVANDPDPSLDFEDASIKAKQYFEMMCPGEEFLPAGPDPDDEFNVD